MLNVNSLPIVSAAIVAPGVAALLIATLVLMVVAGTLLSWAISNARPADAWEGPPVAAGASVIVAGCVALFFLPLSETTARGTAIGVAAGALIASVWFAATTKRQDHDNVDASDQDRSAADRDATSVGNQPSGAQQTVRDGGTSPAVVGRGHVVATSEHYVVQTPEQLREADETLFAAGVGVADQARRQHLAMRERLLRAVASGEPLHQAIESAHADEAVVRGIPAPRTATSDGLTRSEMPQSYVTPLPLAAIHIPRVGISLPILDGRRPRAITATAHVDPEDHTPVEHTENVTTRSASSLPRTNDPAGPRASRPTNKFALAVYTPISSLLVLAPDGTLMPFADLPFPSPSERPKPYVGKVNSDTAFPPVGTEAAPGRLVRPLPAKRFGATPHGRPTTPPRISPPTSHQDDELSLPTEPRVAAIQADDNSPKAV